MKTDAREQPEVVAELTLAPSYTAAQSSEIKEAEGAVVPPPSRVHGEARKSHAKQAAQRVGNKDADVVPIGLGRRTDAEIAHTAVNVLSWARLLLMDSVTVSVDHGWITLAGEVEWEYQRQAAATAVRRLVGVTGVSDHIALKPKVALGVAKAEIEAALRRRAHGETPTILVEIQGADVTLTGTANSWRERDWARNTAWATSGVRNVVDSITVIC